MNSSLLSMFLPQLLKQAEKPELKEKIIKLIDEKKEKTLEDFITNEDCQEVREELDCVLVISATKNDLLVRVMIQDKTTGEMVGNCGIYRYEDIIAAIKKNL